MIFNNTAWGVIDLGSSYFRLLVAVPKEKNSGVAEQSSNFSSGGVLSAVAYNWQKYDRSYLASIDGLNVEIFEDSEYVGWGSDLAGHGIISEEMVNRASEVLKGLIEKTARLGCKRPILCGTNIFRQAKNREEVRARLERTSRIGINVLSEKGEAAFGFMGATSTIDCADDCVMIDLGGTSTEICRGHDNVMSQYLSLKIGTHRVAQDIPRRLHNTFHYRRILLQYIERLKELFSHYEGFDAIKTLSSKGKGIILATGGTAVSLAVLASYLKRMNYDLSKGYRLDFHSFSFIRNRILNLYERGFEERLPLDRARIEFIVPGILLLEAICRLSGIEEFFVTARDLRWGVIMNSDALKNDLVIT